MREEILEEVQSVFVENQEYKWQIKEIGDKVPTAKSFYRKWTFTTFIDGNYHEVEINLFPFQMIPIFETMGIPKVNGQIKVDYDAIEGSTIYAKVFSEKYEYVKDGKQKKGTAYKLKDFRCDSDTSTVPF